MADTLAVHDMLIQVHRQSRLCLKIQLSIEASKEAGGQDQTVILMIPLVGRRGQGSVSLLMQASRGSHIRPCWLQAIRGKEGRGKEVLP